MDALTVDEVVLMAYVDGDLPPDRRAEVEGAIVRSPKLAERLSIMRASMLPYSAAFERQPLPPVPPELERRILDLASVSANSYALAPGPSSDAPGKYEWPRLVAAFFVGALCSAALLLSVFAPRSVAVSPWIKAAASYQEMYSRETVADVVSDSAANAKLIGNLKRIDGISVRVPDLRAAGLTFKRVQRLSFHDRAVVQMVYLPDHGEPVALCLAREVGADESPRAWQLGDMHAVVWRVDRLSYVLLTKKTDADLLKLAGELTSEQLPALYSRLIRPLAFAGWRTLGSAYLARASRGNG